jgi:hypothetical protein
MFPYVTMSGPDILSEVAICISGNYAHKRVIKL